MRGLMIKDFCLLAKRKKLLFLYIGIGLMLGYTSDSMFLIAYLTLLSSMLALSTISYDEFDNGYSFLMSLPVNPKVYAIQKHIFVYLVMSIMWLVAFGIQMVTDTIRNIQNPFSEILAMNVIGLLVFFIIISIVLPVDLKYGTEKGRIVLLVLAGGISAFAYLIFDKIKKAEAAAEKIMETLGKLPLTYFSVCLGVLTAAVIGITILCSIKVMENKEY